MATTAERLGSRSGPRDEQPADWGERLLPLLPIALYLAVRAVSVVVLAWMGSRNGSTESLVDSLAKWDGRWYLGIAEGGYDGPPADLTDAQGVRDATTSLGFLPGYPMVIAGVSLLPGVGLLGAALGVNVVAGGVAALGVDRLGREVTKSARTGLLLVVLFAGGPPALSLSMAYTEVLFSASAVWALVGLLERRWLVAGLCTAGAGLVRSTSAALVLAVSLAALVALWERKDGWRPAFALLVAPLGLAGWLGWVAIRTDRIDGWFELRARGWDDGIGAATGTGDHLLDVLSGRNVVLMDVVSVATLLASLVLLVLCARRVPWPMVVYAGATVAVVALSVGFNTGNPRLLQPASFVLLVPVAAGLAARRPSTQYAVAATVVLFGAWYGGYALMVYPFAI